MRIVLDTNVFVSGYLWGGNEEKLIKKCIRREFQNVISPEILLEIDRVLSYDKFDLEKGEIETILENIMSFSILVKPKKRVKIIEEDPGDDKFIECAYNGKSTYIVSGDKHLLRLGKTKGIIIVSAKEMLGIE